MSPLMNYLFKKLDIKIKIVAPYNHHSLLAEHGIKLLMGLTTRALQVPRPLPMKLNPRLTLSYLTHKVSVKVSRRYVGCMAYRATSKVVIPSGTYWSPLKTKTLWSAKVGPYIASNVVTSPVMMNI